MAWLFFGRNKKASATTTQADDEGFHDPTLAAEPLPTDTAPHAEVSATPEPLRSGGFSLGLGREERPAPPPAPPPAPVASPEPLGEVVRQKVRAGARAAARIDLGALGLTPVGVPSLRETAVLYRLAAEGAGATDAPRAIGLWEGYLELRPSDARAWCALGQARLSQARFDQAWDAFYEAHRRDKGDPLTSAALGWLKARQGEHRDAARHYGDALAVDPDNLHYWQALLQAQERVGDPLGAARSRERIQRLTAEPAD